MSPMPPTSMTAGPFVAGAAGMATSPQADSTLFTEMAAEHLGALYGRALRLTGRPEDAEDLVQETCLRAWRSLHRFRSGTNAKAWLFKILRNRHIDDLRASVRRAATASDVEVEGRMPVIDETPESLFMAGRVDAEVCQALMAIPENFRACVILADIEGLSYAEITEKLGTPVGTVMSRLFRGRRAMRRLLTAYGREHGYLRAS